MTSHTVTTTHSKETEVQITIDTNDLSEKDAAILAALIGEQPEAKPKRAPKKTAAKQEPEPEPEPTPEPEEEEDLVGGDDDKGPTLPDALDAAKAAVAENKQRAVKQALAAVDTKRVSDLAEENVAPFMAALQAALDEE